MKLNEYRTGDKVTVSVLGEERPAKVLDVSDEGVEVELNKSFYLESLTFEDYIVYLDPATYMKRFLIKYEGIIDRIK